MSNTKINPFTGEEEPMPDHLISLSPADQRRAAAPPNTDPLPDAIQAGVTARGDAPGVDLDTHTGGSMTQDPIPGKMPLPVLVERETPHKDISVQNMDEYKEPDQGEYPPNDKVMDDKDASVRIGTEVDNSGYAGIDTKAYNESIEKRREAEAEERELPPIEPAVPGGQVSNGESSADTTEQESNADEHETSKAELLERAKELDISGRSSMKKDELAEAVEAAESEEG